jgi:pantoate--beta-alanine ligase
MYPKDYSTYVCEEKLSKVLCGKSRPGHFKGVTTVVTKLFNIVQPHIAFFGQKDAQQALVIQKMVKDLAWDIHLEIVSTVRDLNGVAYSSRNALLSSKDRDGAVSLNEALFMAKIMVAGGERDPKKVVSKMRKIIRSRPSAKVDYIEVVNAQTLEQLKVLKGRILFAVAVWFGKVRLIDNIVVEAY